MSVAIHELSQATARDASPTEELLPLHLAVLVPERVAAVKLRCVPREGSYDAKMQVWVDDAGRVPTIHAKSATATYCLTTSDLVVTGTERDYITDP
jgi:hypothetical protein